MLFLSGWSCEIHGTWENCDISLQWRMCCGPLWSVVRVIHANSIQRFYFWQNSFNFWGNLLNDATCKECTCYIRISYWSQVLGIWRREMETVGYQGFESSGDVLWWCSQKFPGHFGLAAWACLLQILWIG